MITSAACKTLPAVARIAGAAALAMGLLVNLANPAVALEKITYLLPAPPSLPAFAPWAIAKHLGYYAEAGYDVEFATAKGGVDVAKQVGVGNAQIGGAIGDTPIIVRSNGVPVKAVAVLGGGALTVIVARGDRGISKIEDLRGKKLSVMSFQDTTYFALLGTLASKGMSKSDVRTEAVGPGWVVNFLDSGKADACACSPDMEADAKTRIPNTVSLPTAGAFPSMAQAILASDETIAKRPEMVRAIVKATLKGMKFVMDDPDAAARIYVQAAPSFVGKEAQIAATLRNFVERTYRGQKVLGEIDADRLQKLQAFYLKQGFIQNSVPVHELYTNEFIK